MIVIPTDQTGNKKLDAIIARAKQKDPALFKEIPELTEAFEKVTNKYHVVDKEFRTDQDGTLFASKREMDRWNELVLWQKAGEIQNLRRQVEFMVQPPFAHLQYGNVRKIIYVADFVYWNNTLRKGIGPAWVVEDAKGVKTKEYQIKRKMFLKKYPYHYFFEV